jgi:predicted ribonuclease YlaK
MEAKIRHIVMKAAIIAKGSMYCILIGFLPGTNRQEMEIKIQTCHDYMMILVKFKETNPSDEDVDKYVLEHPLPDYTDLENMLNMYLP